MSQSAIGKLFPLFLVTIPEVFAKINPAQIPSDERHVRGC